MINKSIWIGLWLICHTGLAHAQLGMWETEYEKSGFTKTGRYDEAISLAKRLEATSDWVWFTSIGQSPQGRDIPLIVVDKDGLRSPEQAHAAGKAVVLVQACIHPGESEGKDAGFMLIRDMVIMQQHTQLLDHVTLLFLPIFNVDGHERFGPYHRINQNGPEEAGWRTNAGNLNLNRDFLKADAPEMKAWLTFFNHWLPDLFIDCHTSDGADYQYILTYSLEIYGNMDKNLTAWQRDQYIPFMEQNMFRDGFPVFPYVTFRRWFDPTSGLVRGIAPPMISQGYTALRNRPGILVETHMLKPYKPRVESTYALIKHTLDFAGAHHKTLKALVAQADENAGRLYLHDGSFPVKWGVNYSDSTEIPFLGVGFSATRSDLTGGTWFRYDGGPETLKLWLFDKHLALNEVRLPAAYIIPPEWEEVIERLRLHGIRMWRLSNEVEIVVSTYVCHDYQWSGTPYEGRFRLNTRIREEQGTERYHAGSMIVPMQQAAARLIAYALEPQADGSFLNWGFFNPVFEQKEYAETYVMEKMAREMIIADPALKAEFDAMKNADPAFAQNQWAQLNWFYSHTPYWDPKKDRYPVGRIMDDAILKELGLE